MRTEDCSRSGAGVALPVVLFAMTMASALTVGGAYVTRQLVASARFAQRANELHPAAEHAIVDAIVAWDTVARNEQPVGAASILPAPDLPGIHTDAWVTRTGTATYWLVADASTDLQPVLRRRIGVLLRVSGGVAEPVPQRAWSELP
jgi:hypothetical protein